jgi:hypothetical protein
MQVPIGVAAWGRGRGGHGERVQVEGDGRRAPASPAVGPRRRGSSSGPQQTNGGGALNSTSMARDTVASRSQQVNGDGAPNSTSTERDAAASGDGARMAAASTPEGGDTGQADERRRCVPSPTCVARTARRRRRRHGSTG